MKNTCYFQMWLLSFLVFGFVSKGYAVSGMLPKTPAANHVYVFDCRSDASTARMIAIALQGLINTTSAETYLLQANRHKAQLIESGKGFSEIPLLAGSDPGLRTLFRRYMDRVKKMIVFDTAKDWTWNIALMKAAQENGLPVTNNYKNKLMNEFGWNGTIEDVRTKWTNRIDAYTWAVSNLMPGCNKNQVVFSLGLRDDWINAPWLLYDYAIATKGFIFWLDEAKADEKKMLIDICKAGDYTAGSVVMGYSQSGDDLLEVVNEFGIGYVVSDFYANGSFWASFPGKTYNQESSNAVPVENGKIYVSIIWSDGDNIQFDQNALYQLWKDDPARGSIPVGTTLGAALQEINTPLLDWFYAIKTANDELLAGPSGYQFIYVRDYGAGHYPTWLRLNNEWLADAGFHTACVWHTSFSNPRLTEYLRTAGLDAIFIGDNDMPAPFTLNGVAVLNQGESLWNEGDLYNALAGLSPNPVGPIFKNVYPIAAFYGYNNGAPVGFTRLQREITRLNNQFPDRFVFLLPKDLAATMREYFASDITSANFDTRGNAEEAVFLYDNGNAPIDNDHRFADLTWYWSYRFDIADQVTAANIILSVAGHYVITGSKDHNNWIQLDSVEQAVSQRSINVDISALLHDNLSNMIFIKFHDGSPSDGFGPSLWHLSLNTSTPSSVIELLIVDDFILQQNYPNPFNPETIIKFSLPQESFVELTIYNLLGQKIRTLLNENYPAGDHSAIWKGRNNLGKIVNSGVYLFRIKAGDFEDTRKMTFMK